MRWTPLKKCFHTLREIALIVAIRGLGMRVEVQ